jgi:hypothetical protein
MCQDATIQKRAQLAFDKSRNRTVALLLPGQESLEVLSEYTINDALLGITRTVASCRITNNESGIK